MYLDYLGLREHPFSVTTDPAFLYLSRRHREALSHMMYGIRERKGFIEITGEIGTGKTTLCKALLRQLEDTTRTALILHSGLSELQLLQAVIQDFGLDPMRGNRFGLFNELNRFLIEQATLGNNIVLIIDEAQNLSLRVLEQIRMLSNLETDKQKLVQIVLVGQPQLRDKLDRPSLRQLQQRIGVRYHILPLDGEEVRTYIEHRLGIAGSDGSLAFTGEAFEEIYRCSNGIPRLMNLVCDRALLACYVLRTKLVDRALIQRSYQELMGQVPLSTSEPVKV
ncbi:MAG TPA: ATPase [Candidatus Omnitrophica bacterium]|nr:ATPase [Candidatus Omnitrophota bacterium]HBQ38882.1 ATPase [Candidatus Omnitrophota bacterium]